MGIFADYLLNEAGRSPADQRAIDNLTKQIELIDKQIEAKVGPTGKGPLMNKSGEDAGHINEKDPQYKALTTKRATLVAKRLKLTNKQ